MSWRTARRLAALLLLGPLAAASADAKLALLVLASVAGLLVLLLVVVAIAAVFGNPDRRKAALETLKALLGRPG
jgi:hypothetical protein